MQQAAIKKSTKKDAAEWKGYLLGIVQEIEVWPYYQMVYSQTRLLPGEWNT